jgi:acetyl/propionyl-CoA carboxylase alpha subunit
MGYQSASMVEFIVDMLFGDFDFMKMNTQMHVTLSYYLIIF